MDYVIEEHGRDKVCALGTFQYTWAKGAIKDIGKILGIPYETTNKIAKKIDGSMDFKEVMEQGVLDEYKDDYPELFDYAQKLSGLPKSFGTHACFTAGHKVLTDEGYKSIEDIEVGDNVLTHKNNFNPVVRTMTHTDQHTVNIDTMTNKDVCVTPTHPIYAKVRTSKEKREFKNPAWVPAKNLKRGDAVCVPIIQEEIPFQYKNLPTDNPDFWWIVGAYLGDGWLAKRDNREQVFISCHKEKYTPVLSRIINLFGKGHYSENRTTINVCYESIDNELYEMLQDFGQYAYGKKIPGYVMRLPNHLLKGLLDGYFFADGSKVYDGGTSYSSVSKELAYGIAHCVNKVYKVAVKVKIREPQKYIIEGRVVNGRKQYRCDFHPIRRKRSTWEYDETNKCLWVPVYSVSDNTSTHDVYNITVAGDSSYTVDSMAVHNCGIVLSNNIIVDMNAVDMTDSMPVLMLDMHGAEDLGMVKFDFLGLKTVDIIYDTLELLGKTDDYIAPHNIDWNDQRVWAEFEKGNTELIFQFSSEGMKGTLQGMKANSIHDLTVANALYRPGSMAFISDYTRRKAGLEEPQYLHPDLKPILESTYGIIVFQEQLIEIGKLAKLQNPDILRKATGKKDVKLMAKVKPELTKGLIDRGWAVSQVDELWDIMIEFSKYSFNKSHSAAYSILAYQTMYLKVHHPEEFLVANINIEGGDLKKLRVCYEEARRLGVNIVKPTWRNITGKAVLA